MKSAVPHYGGVYRWKGPHEFDAHWMVQPGTFAAEPDPRRWKRARRASCTWQCTVFGQLVRLGVLEKVEGPVRHDPEADRRQFGGIWGISFAPKVTLLTRRNNQPPKPCR